jgi:hypothetical protein
LQYEVPLIPEATLVVLMKIPLHRHRTPLEQSLV